MSIIESLILLFSLFTVNIISPVKNCHSLYVSIICTTYDFKINYLCNLFYYQYEVTILISFIAVTLIQIKGLERLNRAGVDRRLSW